MKSNKIILSTMLMLVMCMLFQYCVTAQQPYDWNKYTVLSFKEDSISSFQNEFVKADVIPSIAQSKYKIEIRQYIKYTSYSETVVNTLKIAEDSIFIEIHRIRRNIVNGQYTYRDTVIRHEYESGFDDAPDSLLLHLHQNQFFTIADQTNLLDKFESKGIQINDPCKGIVDCFSRNTVCYELKVGNKIRNFNLLAGDYYKVNNKQDIFLYTANIHILFSNLFRIHQSRVYELEKNSTKKKATRQDTNLTGVNNLFIHS